MQHHKIRQEDKFFFIRHSCFTCIAIMNVMMSWARTPIEILVPPPTPTTLDSDLDWETRIG